ncbi:MAG: hypothetical protein KGZ60_04990 [Truepera sp.]|nr:hypothetical protein [Truepera sp.]
MPLAISRMLAGLALLALSSCAFTYIPLIPEARTLPPSLDLRGSAGLLQDGDSLALHLTLREVPAADWLAVQWYAPDNRIVASESIWVDPSSASTTRVFFLPAEATWQPGLWRAVVSFQGQVVRQFSLAVEAG